MVLGKHYLRSMIWPTKRLRVGRGVRCLVLAGHIPKVTRHQTDAYFIGVVSDEKRSRIPANADSRNSRSATKGLCEATSINTTRRMKDCKGVRLLNTTSNIVHVDFLSFFIQLLNIDYLHVSHCMLLSIYPPLSCRWNYAAQHPRLHRQIITLKLA